MRKTFRTILYIILSIYSNVLLGQDADYEKTIATPNVAELGKYGAIPVSKYTGIPSVNLPFYEMNFYGLKIPVGLSYHSGGGMKPMQEATWVGLGWSLTTNAVITRQIVQRSDINPVNSQPFSGYVYGKSMPGIFTESFRESLVNPKVPFPIDTEPDIFMANIFGATSKFHLVKKVENEGEIGIRKLDESNNIITYDEANDVFTIVDSQGFTFLFESKEYSTNFSASNTSTSSEPQENEYTTGGVTDLQKTTMAWYLDEVTAPNGKKLNFNYLAGVYLSVSQSNLSETVTNTACYTYTGGGSGGLPSLKQNEHVYTSQRSLQLNKYLEEIVDLATGNTITFETSERLDLFDGDETKFYSDMLYADINAHKRPQKLDRIIIKDSKLNEKVFEFSYSYFNDHRFEDPEKEAYLRLKLDQVIINNEKEYSFDYIQPNELPKKTTKDVDYWGYYNNAGNKYRYPAYEADYARDCGTGISSLMAETERAILVLPKSGF